MFLSSVPSPSFRAMICSAVLAATASLGGCGGDDGPGKLFEESGTWEVVQYNLEGGELEEVNTMTREAAFLLQFTPGKKVVQTAMCGQSDRSTPDDSRCRLSPSSTDWYCGCFAYAFEGERMRWVEFEAGQDPPSVKIDGQQSDPPAEGTGGTGGTGDPPDTGGGETSPGTEIMLSEFATIANTYLFTPLPANIFGSNGSSSRFMVQQKTPTLFDQVFDDPDGRNVCEPCIPQ